MDAKNDCLLGFDALWTPSDPLPTRRVLREMVGLYGRIWGQPNLAGEVRVVYNTRLSTTLGRALFEQTLVELNPRLLAEHPQELVSTLGHELAHILVRKRHGQTPPHGPQFKALMDAAGLSASPCHQLPVEHLRRRRGKYLYLHRCGDCGNQFVARSTRRHYYCLNCGPEMKWDIFRLPNTPPGQKLLKHLLGKAGIS